jgi:hypothetical protein
MEDKRKAGHPIDTRVEWFAYARLGDAVDFPLTIKPKSSVPFKWTLILIGADIVARFAWETRPPAQPP